MNDLSRDAQLLLLIIAAAGGEMGSDDAEREHYRVRRLPCDAFKRWVVLAQIRARYWYERRNEKQ